MNDAMSTSPTPTPPTLANALRQAGAELATRQPPAGLHAAIVSRLQAEPRASGRAAAVARPAWRWSAFGATALTLLLVGAVVLRLQPSPAPELTLQVSGFVPVVAAERWPADSAAAWLVSTELRRDRLALLGLPFDPGRAGESVRAELLVQDSGEVLAVRLLP